MSNGERETGEPIVPDGYVRADAIVPVDARVGAVRPAGARPPCRTSVIARVAALLLVAASLPTAFAAEPDLSRTRPSDGGAFVVAVDSRVEPVPLNVLHAWVVHLETADGAPVEGATFAVDGGMPMHDHGLPTAPRVTEELGGGDYLLEGVKFQMPGHWVVSLDIVADGVEDSVTFELVL